VKRERDEAEHRRTHGDEHRTVTTATDEGLSELHLRHAAVDGEIHAGSVRAFIRGEEQDGCRDFLGLAPATHWDLRGELGDRLLDLFRGEAHLLQSRGFDWPGLIEFTRILRSFSSIVQPRAKLRTAALLAAYAVKPGTPNTFEFEEFRMIEPPSLKRGRAFCTVKNNPFTLTSKVFSK